MSIDITQQALNALAGAGLGNDSPAEAYVIGYTQGHNDALALAIRIEQSISATPLTHTRPNDSPSPSGNTTASARPCMRAASASPTASSNGGSRSL